MAAMEMVSETPDDKSLRDLFDDIKKTLSLRSVNSDYRTLALWPDYLADAWGRLKPVTGRDEYTAAADRLRETARTLARTSARTRFHCLRSACAMRGRTQRKY